MSMPPLIDMFYPGRPNFCPKCGKRTYLSRTKKKVLVDHGEVNIFCACGRVYTYVACSYEDYVKEIKKHAKH